MLKCLVLTPSELRTEELSREFPTVEVVVDPAAPAHVPIVDAAAWAEPSFDVSSLDGRVAEAAGEGAFGLRIEGDARDAFAVLTRYQRFLDRRNEASAGPTFDAILEAHRALHDFDLPLCRADYDHALDTWQWLLRLEPEASLALQAAALFHDIERLESEASVRVEHLASSYRDFKEAHAQRGAVIARAALTGRVLDGDALARIAELVREHELPREDPEGVSLAEADALSFFSLNSSGFIDYYGVEHTRRKVDYTLRRLRPSARDRLCLVRLRADVANVMREIAV